VTQVAIVVITSRNATGFTTEAKVSLTVAAKEWGERTGITGMRMTGDWKMMAVAPSLLMPITLQTRGGPDRLMRCGFWKLEALWLYRSKNSRISGREIPFPSDQKDLPSIDRGAESEEPAPGASSGLTQRMWFLFRK